MLVAVDWLRMFMCLIALVFLSHTSQVQSARGGATVPAEYLEQLEDAERAGLLERWVDEIATAEAHECEPNAGTIRLTCRCRGGAGEVFADRVVLATGSTLDINQVPLLRSVATRYELPVAGSLPDLDEDLQWGNESFTVVGNFALLQTGPDSGNLTGCRRCAERCVDALGGFEAFTKAGPLMNKFSALVGSSDEEDSSDSED